MKHAVLNGRRPLHAARCSRRAFLRASGAMGALAGLEALLPGYALARPRSGAPAALPPRLEDGVAFYDLTIAETPISVDSRRATATTINGTVPGPRLELHEGTEAVLRVTNRLDEDTSIHWHGLILPPEMDGVPGVSFPGIRPGETFEYRFPVRQSGTYWYHSHSGLQEQVGHYGPLIIHPAEGYPYAFDREYTILLSDWTFENPYRILARLRKQPDYYNRRQRTVFDFLRDAARDGLGATIRDRLMWGGMRMNPTDISDVTGAAYTFLMNGLAPDDEWTGLFRPGERVLLRFINASAATYFDVRIPGLPMTVVQADGQYVAPVETDEFRIAIAETYDVVVEPTEERAYTVFAEAMDRSGFARGTLTPREGLEAPVPERRERPVLTMTDMGMDHGSGDAGHAGHGTDASPPGLVAGRMEHGPDTHGPGNAGVPEVVQSRLHEPGTGLGDDGWRVLTYADLRSLHPEPRRAPDREIELHLTGNMERFTWSIDGVAFAESEPIRFDYGERVRLTFVNDTMMNHPMHLHGMWMELENGHGERIPRVHTINVKPAERVSLLVTADAPGRWAFHCHVLYHMEVGMFRVVEVAAPHHTVPEDGDAGVEAHHHEE